MPPKKADVTPKSQIVSSLRLLFLRSRERAFALKREKNTCECCGRKQSKAKGKEVKVEVHHLQEGDINWKHLEDAVRRQLLCPPSELAVLCRECHKHVHETGEL